MSSDVVIRTARSDDVATISLIHCDAALRGFAHIFPAGAPRPTPATLEPDWVRMIEHPRAIVLVADADADGVVGCAALRPDPDVPAGVILARLYVDPECWGRGIGSALHDACLDVAAAAGTDAIGLWVLEANTRAREMYERRGWRLLAGRTKPNEPSGVVDVHYEVRPLLRPG